MPFETLSARLQAVATKTLAYCKARYGNSGVKLDEGVDDSIQWRPTFYLKQGKLRIIAVEIEDNLCPEILKSAAYDINNCNFPIQVYQSCSFDAFQTDPKHLKINLLRRHGFGIITVDDDGNVIVQQTCIPLAQHINPDKFDSEIRKLSSGVGVAFRAAYDT